MVSNSEEVVHYLKNCKPGKFRIFSIDAEDLYYSIPQRELIGCVQRCFDVYNDECEFVNKCCVSVRSFLELLSCYLRSTVIGFEGKLYLQREGICIGSRIAPVLSNIFLGCIDEDIEQELGWCGVKIFRYVDDYLVIVDESKSSRTLGDVLDVFKSVGKGLKFTYEVPQQNELRFLDLMLSASHDHICWEFWPRSKKEILSYSSGHSKIVKDGIAGSSVLRSAINKTCLHRINECVKTGG